MLVVGSTLSGSKTAPPLAIVPPPAMRRWYNRGVACPANVPPGTTLVSKFSNKNGVPVFGSIVMPKLSSGAKAPPVKLIAWEAELHQLHGKWKCGRK